ncbi:anti-sigma factor [Clostridium sediminicola]|uniref:anti sigma factor C-terminal domain-containing protein n=1 Tax=Clostridium sediminicola TaxID=3114879 RepID=UPI0031F2594D
MKDNNDNTFIESEEELDKIFEDAKNNKIRKAVKKAKRLSTLKMILISLSTLIILAITITTIGNEIIGTRLHDYISTIDYQYTVQAPNKFPGMFSTFKNAFRGETQHHTFKYINGKRVFTGEYGITYNWINENFTEGTGSFVRHTEMTNEELNFLPRYNNIGQKLMIFYYPYVDYGSKYSNDLSLLEDVGNDKFMEIALSFDKSYSINEVDTMIPKDINLTWYWVDSINDDNKDRQKHYFDIQENSNGEKIEVEQFVNFCYEDDAYGIKAQNEYGEKIKNPEEYFIEALKEGKITHIYDIMSGEDGELTKDDIRVQGIVVTGDAENLKFLRELPFIKASSLGVVTDKY